MKKYWGLLLVILFSLLLLLASHADNLMDQRAKYSIGYITGWHFSAKNGKYFEFRFTAADSTYEGASLSDKGMATANGSRFVVKYDSASPATNVGYFNLGIPDSIRRAPANGWRVPPFPVPAWVIDSGKDK